MSSNSAVFPEPPGSGGLFTLSRVAGWCSCECPGLPDLQVQVPKGEAKASSKDKIYIGKNTTLSEAVL